MELQSLASIAAALVSVVTLLTVVRSTGAKESKREQEILVLQRDVEKWSILVQSLAQTTTQLSQDLARALIEITVLKEKMSSLERNYANNP